MLRAVVMFSLFVCTVMIGRTALFYAVICIGAAFCCHAMLL